MRVSRMFRARFRERFYDPAFEAARADVDKLAARALMRKVRGLRGKRFDEGELEDPRPK